MEVLNVMDWTIGLNRHGNYYSGFVNHLEQVLESHRVATTTSWGLGIRSSNSYGRDLAGSEVKENHPPMVDNCLLRVYSALLWKGIPCGRCQN